MTSSTSITVFQKDCVINTSFSILWPPQIILNLRYVNQTFFDNSITKKSHLLKTFCRSLNTLSLQSKFIPNYHRFWLSRSLSGSQFSVLIELNEVGSMPLSNQAPISEINSVGSTFSGRNICYYHLKRGACNRRVDGKRHDEVCGSFAALLRFLPEIKDLCSGLRQRQIYYFYYHTGELLN